MIAWWQGLSPRDQRVLGGGALVVALLLLWALLIEPAQSARHSLQAQVQAAETDLAFMQQAAQQLSGLQSAGSSHVFDRGGRSLLALADGSAGEARLGAAIKRIEPIAANRVNVWLEQANFDDVALWLEQLQRQFGVRVDELSLQRGSAVGQVDGRLTLLDAPH